MVHQFFHSTSLLIIFSFSFGYCSCIKLFVWSYLLNSNSFMVWCYVTYIFSSTSILHVLLCLNSLNRFVIIYMKSLTHVSHALIHYLKPWEIHVMPCLCVICLSTSMLIYLLWLCDLILWDKLLQLLFIL